MTYFEQTTGVETPELRIHADGRIEQFYDSGWHPGRMSIRADGLVICIDGSIGGTIGGADGLSHPSDPVIARDWSGWKLVGRRGNRRLLVVGDWNRLTVNAKGEFRSAERDEDTLKMGAPSPFGRVDGASSPALIETALWMVGLYHADEQPMCDV